MKMPILNKVTYIVLIIIILNSCTSMNKDTNTPNTANNKNDSKQPFLTTPKVRKIWVPEKIENDKFIEGHYMWILEKTSSWSQ